MPSPRAKLFLPVCIAVRWVVRRLRTWWFARPLIAVIQALHPCSRVCAVINRTTMDSVLLLVSERLLYGTLTPAVVDVVVCAYENLFG